MKSRSSLLAPAHPGGPGKRAVKRLWCGGGGVLCKQAELSVSRDSLPASSNQSVVSDAQSSASAVAASDKDSATSQVRWLLSLLHCFKSVEERLEFGLGVQLPLSGWPHNPTTRFWPTSKTVVSPESLPHYAGHCGACRNTNTNTNKNLCSAKFVDKTRQRRWVVRWWQANSDVCACGEPQTMSHIVDSCQSWLVACPSCTLQMMMLLRGCQWLTNYGGPWRIHTTAPTLLHLYYVLLSTSVDPHSPEKTVKTVYVCTYVLQVWHYACCVMCRKRTDTRIMASFPGKPG